MPIADSEAIEATLELFVDPAAQRRLQRSEHDIDTGRGVDAVSLKTAMERARGHRS